MNKSNRVILLTVDMLIEDKFVFKKIIILRREVGIQYYFGCQSNATTECVIMEYLFYPFVSSGVITLNPVIYYTVFGCQSNATNECVIIEYVFYPLVSSGVIPLNAVIYYTVFVDPFVGVKYSSALNKCLIISSSTAGGFLCVHLIGHRLMYM